MKLNFKTSHPGFKYLKHESLDTLIPLSVIKENNLKDSLIKTEMPVFFHVKYEKFCTFLPDDFFKDINIKEITQQNYHSYLLTEEGNSYLFFSFNNLKDLRNMSTETNFFSLFKEDYDKHLLDITNGQLVIFIAFKNQSSKKLTEDVLGYKFKDILQSNISGSHSNFEFFKAYKFNNKYYLVDNEGNIDQNNCFDMQKKSNANMNHLVIPYTDNDWVMAQNIYQNITDIKSKIDSIFNQQHQTGLLDKPFSEVSQQLLEDFTPKKIKP